MDLTQKDVKWAWIEVQETAFRELEKRLGTGPVLIHMNPEKQYFLARDASGVAIGVVPSQRDTDGHLRLITFMSQGLMAPQLSYNTHDKESLVIVKILSKWRIYLGGTRVIYRTYSFEVCLSNGSKREQIR